MGAGNVCVFGKCEGLYYVDNGFLDVYSREDEHGDKEYRLSKDVEYGDTEFKYDESESYFNRVDFDWHFAELMRARFPSFELVDKWISEDRKAILENGLFYVVYEDNQWSLAIELIMKEGEYGGEEKVGLQMGLYQKYLKGIEDILLDMYGTVGTYSSAWTSGTITRKVEVI